MDIRLYEFHNNAKKSFLETIATHILPRIIQIKRGTIEISTGKESLNELDIK